MPYDQPGTGGGETSSKNTLPYINSNLKDWTPITIKGIAWSLGSSYAKASGYAGGEYTETEAWLVSPAINATTTIGATIKMSHVNRYGSDTENALNHKLLVTDDYTGDVTTTVWTELGYEPKETTTKDWTFYESNVVKVPEAYLKENIVFALKYTCGSKSATTWEVQNLAIEEGEGGSESGTPGTIAEPKGTGTAADPYNVAAAQALVKTLAADVQSDEVYIAGVVSSITSFSAQYGNFEYYISDDGTTAGQLHVFHGLGLNGAKFTNENELKVGDKVVVKGKLVNYKGNTPEVANGNSLVSLNGNGSQGGNTDQPSGEAKGTGTKDDPFNAVAANQFASKLASGANSEPVYVKGKVSRTKDISVSYKNATFYISEDGTQNDEFYVFRCKGLDNTDIATTNDVMVGDDVVIYGPLTNYQGNTPETVQNECYIVSIVHNATPGTGSDEGGSGSGGTITENSIILTPAEMGIENGKEVGTYTLADGTILTFDGGGNSNAPKYYNAGTNIRMYPKNSVTITAKKKIASVFFDCDTYQGTLCNAGGEVTASNGTASVNAASLLFNNVNSTTTTITNTNSSTGTASQIRITKLVINYAE